MLHLPRWATDCLRRADPSLKNSNRPLALWERQRGAMKLVALDAAASAKGLVVGQTISDARAIVPDLEVREIDRGYTEQVFADLADWHSNASPIVSIHHHDTPWGDLVLDISGVSHLFGGEEPMLNLLTSRLERLGLSVSGSVASTVGAAWAIARYSAGQIVAEGMEERAMTNLPVAALRLDDDQIENLKQFGLRNVGELYGRDRRSLQARFGYSLLLRLDQALGWVEEKIVPRLPLIDRSVERRFPEPIALIEDVLMTAHDLAVSLSIALEADGVGGQSFHLFLYRVDHKVMTLTVNSARATRDPAHIGRLFSYRAERLEGEYDAGFGIDMVRLAVSSLSALDAVQIGAFASNDGAVDLDTLFDLMSSRLGTFAVLRPRLANHYMPEKAMFLEAVVAGSPKQALMRAVDRPRPLRMLPQPEPITVLAEVPDAPPVSMVWRRISYRFAKAYGPERLGENWLRSEARLIQTPQTAELAAAPGNLEHYYVEGDESRDYYVVEDENGHRFWLFRQGQFGIAAEPRWYIHGLFS